MLLSHDSFACYIYTSARSGSYSTPLHTVLPNIHFKRIIFELLLSDKSSPAQTHGQTSGPGGHKWPITAVTLLWSTETTPKPTCCASQKDELSSSFNALNTRVNSMALKKLQAGAWWKTLL